MTETETTINTDLGHDRSDLELLNPEQLHIKNGDIIEAPKKGPADQDLDSYMSALQNRSTPLQCIDIDPYNFKKDDFPCSLTEQDFIKYVGLESGNFTNQSTPALNTNIEGNNHLYWRSYQYSVNANFLKFEFMPGRFNDEGASNSTYAVEPQIPSHSEAPIDPVVAPATIDMKNWIGPKLASDRIVLISFNGNKDILVMRDGMTFEFPITSFEIHFKQWTPRFRLIAGFNAKINEPEHKQTNTTLWAYGAEGFLKNPLTQLTPFCITYRDMYYVKNGVTHDDLLAAEQGYTLIEDNAPYYSTDQSGQIVLFITSMTGMIRPGSAAAHGSLDLYIYKSNKTRRILSIPFCCSANASPYNLPSVEPSDAIRVTLQNEETLRIYLNSISTDQPTFGFSLHGYSLGQLRASDSFAGATTQAPFNSSLKMIENSFTTDTSTYNVPRF